MSNALQTIEKDVYSVQPRFEAINADKSINFQAEAEFALQVLARNDYALGVAMRNRQSVLDAVTNIAAIGISLNPAKRQAYLVPRDGRICLDISYMGLMDLAMSSGAIKWAQCALVYAGDKFTLRGIDQQPVHEFDPFAKDRGELVGVYACVKTNDGDYLTHTMAIADVYAIRDKTQSWSAYKSGKAKSCPWADHEGEMVRKTCIKQASKYWPRGNASARLEKAVQYLNEQAGEGIVIEQPPKVDGIKPTDGMMEEQDIATQNYLRELAENVRACWTTDDVGKCLDMLQREKLDNEATVALWTLLPSDLRAALKAESAARREAKKALQEEA